MSYIDVIKEKARMDRKTIVLPETTDKRTLIAATGADYVIAFRSGAFVQRGAPALLDKYTRTRMALLCGADAVIELPTLYAAASAEYFAQGAVTLMSQLGVVDLLSFGSESGELSSLTKAAELLLSREPADLTQLLKKGLSYSAARTQSFSSLSVDLQGTKKP